MAAPSAVIPNPDVDRSWPLPQRIGFRLIFCYFSLYLVLCWLIDQLGIEADEGVLPGSGLLVTGFGKLWAPVVSWTGRHVLHISRKIVFAPATNSDGIYGYTQLFCIAVLAILAALIWTSIDRKRADYRSLHEWLRISLRYALAFSMFGYGSVKVIDVQFHRDLIHLPMTYGDFGPFDVLVAFMSYSRPYTFFAGAAEVLAGLLLLFRRTVSLGALIAIAVLSNVVMLNFCYDWPEKVNSMHLLAMGAILVAPDLRRLSDVFIRNRATVAAVLGKPEAGTARTRTAAKCLVLVGMAAIVCITAAKMHQEDAVQPPLYGIYKVEEFQRNGQPVPPLATDTARWDTMIVNSPGFIRVRSMDDKWHGYRAAYDAQKQELALTETGAGKPRNLLSCVQPEPGYLILQGPLGADVLSIRLKRRDEAEFNLMKRRFRWINGYP